MTLRLKVFSFNLISVLFAIAVVTIIGIEIVRTTVINSTYEKLNQIRQYKTAEIENYFRELDSFIELISQHKMTEELLTKTNSSVTFQKKNIDAYSLKLNLFDLILINDQGKVIYTTRKDLDDDTHINKKIPDSRLYNAYTWGLSAPRNTSLYLDFKQDPYYENTFTSIIASPIFLDNKIKGIILIKISFNEIDRITSDSYTWNSFGMGSTGETLVYGEDWALRNRGRVDQSSKTSSGKNSFKATGDIDLEYFKTESVLNDRGFDYKGNDVLRSTGKLYLPSGSLWYVSTKLNSFEAFSVLRKIAIATAIAAIIIIILFFIITYITSQKILEPIQLLTERLDEVGPENLPERIDYLSDDEIGVLVEKYNNLSSRLVRTTISKDFLDKLFQSLNSFLFIIKVKKNPFSGRPEFKILNFNESTLKALHFKPEELQNKDFRDLIFSEKHPHDYTKMLTNQKEAQVFLKTARNYQIPVLMNWNHIPSKNPNETTIVLTCTDITERIKIEKDLIEAREQAVNASKAKSEFLARMSHEIRTPLNAIIGINDVLVEEPLKPEIKHMLHLSSNAGENLLALINDILDISKIEAQEVKIERISFDLIELVQSTAEILRQKALEKSIDFNLHLDAQLPEQLNIIGDPTRIRQVLFNLIGNAIKFTVVGSVEIFLGIDPTGKFVIFQIKDTGTGIPQDKRKNLFQSFTQADSSITRKFGGTGLGLTISKSLVDLMGGKIWYESNVNVGSDFFFSIPLEASNEPIKQSAPREPQDLDIQVAKKVLIVDDVDDNRFLVRKFLNDMNFHIDEAVDGVAAVRMAEHENYDLILMDIQMPIMDGYIATQKIRDFERKHPDKPRAKIVAISANAMTEDIKKSYDSGCDGYLTKPIKKIKLIEAIASYLN